MFELNSQRALVCLLFGRSKICFLPKRPKFVQFLSADEDDLPALKYRSAHETLKDDKILKKAEVGVHDDHVAQLQQRLAAEQVCFLLLKYDSAVILCRYNAPLWRSCRNTWLLNN